MDFNGQKWSGYSLAEYEVLERTHRPTLLAVNRRAYVLQSMRPHAESGRYYYFRPKTGKNGEAPSLTAGTVRQHPEGDLTIGVHAMSPATQRCKWIAMDGDYSASSRSWPVSAGC